ncbi:MAG: porin [Sedimenticolaceae bacterium]
MLLLVTGTIFASDPNLDAATQDSKPIDTNQRDPEPVDQDEHDQNLMQYILSPDYRPVRSILFDREAPLLGITWGGTVLYDIPLNSEPDGASTTLRLAKLSYFMKLGERWDLRFNVNYNNAGDFELGNNYMDYTGWKTAKVSFGVFDPAFSLEKVSKREGTTFMERALPVEALSERRSGGVGVLKRTPNSILNAGLFFMSPDYQEQTQSGQALVLHYVHAPLERKKEDSRWGGRKIWTGLSLSYRTNVSESDTQFRSRPEITIGDDYYVDTDAIDGAKDIIRLGFEASKVSGPLSWQTEILTTRVNRQGMESLDFWGAYVFASWFLTGESRNYNPTKGSFLALNPLAPVRHGGKGAFELAARASYVDLNDRDVIGGEQANISLGLNWYANSDWRLMLNLVKVLDVKRPGSIYDGEDPLILSLRGQWYLH